MHTTEASVLSHISSHTVPQVPLIQTSTLPILDIEAPRRRVSPSVQGTAYIMKKIYNSEFQSSYMVQCQSYTYFHKLPLHPQNEHSLVSQMYFDYSQAVILQAQNRTSQLRVLVHYPYQNRHPSEQWNLNFDVGDIAILYIYIICKVFHTKRVEFENLISDFVVQQSPSRHSFETIGQKGHFGGSN